MKWLVLLCPLLFLVSCGPKLKTPPASPPVDMKQVERDVVGHEAALLAAKHGVRLEQAQTLLMSYSHLDTQLGFILDNTAEKSQQFIEKLSRQTELPPEKTAAILVDFILLTKEHRASGP